MKDEQGTAAVELVMFLALLVLLMAVGVSATTLVADQNHLNQVTETAARYATRASADPADPRPYGTAPTGAAVAAYVAEISHLPVLEVTVSPDPTLAAAGSDVTVAVTLRRDGGPLAEVANAVSGLLGEDPAFPEGGMQMRSAVTMRKE